MWPFSQKLIPKPVPSIRVGDILVDWNRDYDYWEFTFEQQDYTMTENPQFNPAIFDRLPQVKVWIEQLESEINQEISKQLAGWGPSDGQKELLSVDVSWILEKEQVELSYSHEA
jgi:hypothetical protein